MKIRHHKLLEGCKRKLRERLARRPWHDQPSPVPKPVNIVYDPAQRTRALSFLGVGLIHTRVARLGLAQAVDERASLLKAHLPYFESEGLTGSSRPRTHPTRFSRS